MRQYDQFRVRLLAAEHLARPGAGRGAGRAGAGGEGAAAGADRPGDRPARGLDLDRDGNPVARHLARPRFPARPQRGLVRRLRGVRALLFRGGFALPGADRGRHQPRSAFRRGEGEDHRRFAAGQCACLWAALGGDGRGLVQLYGLVRRGDPGADLRGGGAGDGDEAARGGDLVFGIAGAARSGGPGGGVALADLGGGGGAARRISAFGKLAPQPQYDRGSTHSGEQPDVPLRRREP